MSTAHALAALAARIDQLIIHPDNLARTRELAESALAHPVEGHIESLQLPTDPNDELDWTPDSLARKRGLEPYAQLMLGQSALVLGALHDVHCPHVEQVIVSQPMTITEGQEELTPAQLCQYAREARRIVLLNAVRQLGEYATAWFTALFHRYEEQLCAPATPVGGIEVPPTSDDRISDELQSAASAKPVVDPMQEEPEVMVQYVTLNQIAALLNLSKKTLERRKNENGSTMPSPDVEGGGGRSDLWIWERVRPWIIQMFGREVPSKFPSLH